jgi:hypothetical protein
MPFKKRWQNLKKKKAKEKKGISKRNIGKT